MPLGVGLGQNVGLRDFCHILTLLPPGHLCFTNTCLHVVHFVILGFRSLQPELAHANEINRDIHRANTVYWKKVR